MQLKINVIEYRNKYDEKTVKQLSINYLKSYNS